MSRFHCGGSLRITINDVEPLRPRVKLVHQNPHVPWVDISPSDEIKAYIVDNRVLGPTRVSIDILAAHASVALEGNPAKVAGDRDD